MSLPSPGKINTEYIYMFYNNYCCLWTFIAFFISVTQRPGGGKTKRKCFGMFPSQQKNPHDRLNHLLVESSCCSSLYKSNTFSKVNQKKHCSNKAESLLAGLFLLLKTLTRWFVVICVWLQFCFWLWIYFVNKQQLLVSTSSIKND